MTSFKAAVVQMRSSRDVAQNVRLASELVREAASAGADFIATPENTPLMETERAHIDAAAFSDDGANPTIEAFQTLAREVGRWLLLGSLAVKTEEERLANRSVLIAPDGRIAARYDKIHMFDVTVSEAERYQESHAFRPGREAVLARLPWGVLGMSVCYDVRFPYLYRALAKAGAQFLSVPSAFTKVTGQAHWHVLLRARAIETGCYVFAPAQGGRHENGRETFGHSLIVDPWGRVIAEAGEEPAIAIAKIDPAGVARARSRIPALTHDSELAPVRLEPPQ
jgi:predicted amidohydrolase